MIEVVYLLVVGGPIQPTGWDVQDLGGPVEQCREAVKACVKRAVQARQSPRHIAVAPNDNTFNYRWERS